MDILVLYIYDVFKKRKNKMTENVCDKILDVYVYVLIEYYLQKNNSTKSVVYRMMFINTHFEKKKLKN